MTPCHACTEPATIQWQRHATPDETEQHWTAVEGNIRTSNSGHPAATYEADRTDTVVKAVHGCDDHQVDDTTIVHAADCHGDKGCGCE